GCPVRTSQPPPGAPDRRGGVTGTRPPAAAVRGRDSDAATPGGPPPPDPAGVGQVPLLPAPGREDPLARDLAAAPRRRAPHIASIEIDHSSCSGYDANERHDLAERSPPGDHAMRRR